jgi:hypothetical protein
MKMKTKLIIEFETNNMKRVVPEEYIGKGEECPEDEVMTKDVEKGLHSRFVFLIKDMLTKGEMGYDRFEEFMIEDDNGVEGFDELDDYGDIKITVTEETPKPELSCNSG